LLVLSSLDHSVVCLKLGEAREVLLDVPRHRMQLVMHMLARKRVKVRYTSNIFLKDRF
jgi:hypothetical protein